MAAFGRSSPYSKTSTVNGYLGILNFIDIPAEVDDVSYTIASRYMYRPDLLAYDLYGDPQLWWVFAARNKEVIKDSIYDFITGQIIFLPKLAAIKKAIGGS